MTFERTQVGDKIVLRVAGRMDAENAVQFERECQSCIADWGTTLIVDFADLAYVSSMGLRSVVAIAKDLRTRGGELRLCRLTGLVRHVFEITRLNTVFPPHETVESALMEG